MTPDAIPFRSTLVFKVGIVFGAILLLEAAFLGSLALIVEQTKQQFETQREVQNSLLVLSKAIFTIQETFENLAEIKLAKDHSRVGETYQANLIKMKEQLSEVGKVAEANKSVSDKALLLQIKESCEQFPEICEEIKAGESSDEGMALLRLDGVYHDVFPKSEEMGKRYRRVNQELDSTLGDQSRLLLNLTVLLGFGLNAGIALLLYFSFVSKLSKRLKAVSDEMVQLAMGKQLPPRTDGNGDEIDRLSVRLRDMGARLDRYRAREKSMLENAPSFICALDKEAVFTEVSAGSSALWGYTPEEMLGQRLTAFVVGDPEMSKEKISQAFSEGIPISIENRIKTKDGNEIELSWHCQIADGAKSVVCVAQDVTRRNASLRVIRDRQQEFRAIVDGMPHAVVTCDDSFEINTVNPATEKIFQYQPNELFNNRLSLLLTGDRRARGETLTQLGNLMRLAEEDPVEINARRKDGGQIPIALHSQRYEVDAVTMWLAAFEDVSARKEIERLKQDFVAMISHDLRSPLTALRGTLEMLVEDEKKLAEQAEKKGAPVAELPEEQSLVSAHKVVEGLVSLMNDFLDLEKFEANMAAIENYECTVGSLIDAVLENFNPAVVSRVVHGSVDREVKIKGDRARLCIAWTNALTAVIHHSTEDQFIRLSLSKNRGGFELKFTSDDFQLPIYLKNACFSRYVLVPKEDIGPVASSGFGLSLARNIILAHGGTFHIESKFRADSFVMRFSTRYSVAYDKDRREQSTDVDDGTNS